MQPQTAYCKAGGHRVEHGKTVNNRGWCNLCIKDAQRGKPAGIAMNATPTNRFGGALPEDQGGQPYDFGMCMDEATEALHAADRLHHNLGAAMSARARRERIEHYLREAEKMIEMARKVMP